MQLVPDGVVNATSSPRGVLVPLRSATWKSAPSTGGADSTQVIASPIGAEASGAAVEVTDDRVVGVPLVPVPGAALAEVRDGEMGVSWVGRDWLPCWMEQPATSTDAANNRAIRMAQG
jgi:hypothetical protein